MKIYIVALMAFMNGQPEGFEPPMAYVFTEPTFNSVPECKAYATINGPTILYKLYEEFGNEYRPHMVSCVNESVVEELQHPSRKFRKELET